MAVADANTAPIVAATISGTVAFLAAVFTKETKTSEFRQAWIDALRSDISELLAYASALAFFVDSKRKYKVEDGDIVEKLYEKDEDYVAFQTCRRRIILRLNPKEHARLAKDIDELGGVALLDMNGETVKCRAENITSQATEILKKEWKRVKRGEWIFVFAKWGSLGLLLVGAWYFVWPPVVAMFSHQP